MIYVYKWNLYSLKLKKKKPTNLQKLCCFIYYLQWNITEMLLMSIYYVQNETVVQWPEFKYFSGFIHVI